MNILQIVPNKGWGGGERYVWELSRSLSEAGHDVSVVIPPCDILAERFVGLNTCTLRFRGPYDPGAIYRLARLVEEHKIEIIHTHIFKHATAALLARKLYGLDVRVVMTRHLCRPAKKSLHYPWLYRHIDRLIFVSAEAERSFLSSGPQIAADRMTVITNSVRPDAGTWAVDLRPELGLGDNTFLIAFAGTIMPEKGVEFILDLAAGLRKIAPPIVFVLAGKTPEGKEAYMEHLRSEVARRGLGEQVRFLGFIDRTIAFFRQADAVIVPTLIPESFGLVVVEAMIAEKPIFFSENIPSEVITPEEGVRIDVEDVQESCRLIRELAQDPARQQLLAERGHRRWQERFTYDRFLERILDAYRN
ncbi:MAG: glycosyltransferase family 4 protein [Rikenellaceae bacterium]|nr:glycosyltransferase family 4 protein [Rikenellaceae bacterium]